jgi:hypothetical protein
MLGWIHRPAFELLRTSAVKLLTRSLLTCIYDQIDSVLQAIFRSFWKKPQNSAGCLIPASFAFRGQNSLRIDDDCL